ncbi:MAG TPA: FAD-binding domain [Caulobacteraceae bacterium]|jgi:2-polyprenyl-6-methoxyphenol hydroxylase-like FAD-dependent oxidoreductase
MRIAISGAGVAGPTLAYWLRRGGHEAALIEAAPALRTGGYMIDFWGVGYDVAERMGILSEVRSRGYQIEEVRYLDRHGRRGAAISADTIRRELADRFTSLSRGDLASVIYEALDDGVSKRFGDVIKQVTETAGGVELTFAGGGRESFDLLVGADGAHSNVRRLAFGPDNLFERRIGYHVAAFEADGYRPRDELAYVSIGYAGRQLARFSKRADRTMFLLVFADERLESAEPATLAARKAVLCDLFADAGDEWPAIKAALSAADELYFDRVSQIVMPAWSKGRVALVGDAAACVSLVAGEGTGLAMTEAYVLAGELGAGTNYADAFAAYERRLRPFIDGKQRAARAFASSFTPRTALGVWFRNQVTQLMAIPGLAGLVLGAQMRDDFQLPDYR